MGRGLHCEGKEEPKIVGVELVVLIKRTFARKKKIKITKLR